MDSLRWLIDGYDEWLARQGLPIVEGLAVDLPHVETRPWARLGANAAFVHVHARGDFLSLYLCDLAPGQTTEPQRHLYEGVFYVLSGSGSTSVELPGGDRRTFEWRRGSLFALPLNMPYRLFNASGKDRARLACVSDLPLVMKLYRNEKFVFDTPFDFVERLGEERHLRGEGTFIPVREHKHMWETNFVPDVLSFDQMRESPGRGRGSTSIQFMMADGTQGIRLSQVPPGDYKKAHRHEDGVHIFQLTGDGYSLYWRDGEPPLRVDWTYGLLHAPPLEMWHQHFNVGDEPGRYLHVSVGSQRYPFWASKRKIVEQAVSERHESQIEYADEDPSIRRLFDAERASFLSGRVSSRNA